MKKYQVVYERTETYREVFEVEANSREEASEIAEELNCEHDWTENAIVHGDENEVGVIEVECDVYSRV